DRDHPHGRRRAAQPGDRGAAPHHRRHGQGPPAQHLQEARGGEPRGSAALRRGEGAGLSLATPWGPVLRAPRRADQKAKATWLLMASKASLASCWVALTFPYQVTPPGLDWLAA